MHNLVDIANKHTIAGKITIGLTCTTKHIHLFVKNSGSLVQENIVEWINSEQEMTDPQKIIAPNQVRGIGVVLVKEPAAILDIGLPMESNDFETNVQLAFDVTENEEFRKPAVK